MKLIALLALSVAAVSYSDAKANPMLMDFCVPCCDLVSYIVQEIERDESKEEALASAECAKLSQNSLIQSLCSAALNEVIKLADGWLNKAGPVTICSDLHFCNGGACSGVRPESLLRPAVPAQGSQQQELCNSLQEVESEIQSGKIDELCAKFQIDQMVPGLCEQIKSFEPQVLNVLKMAGNFLHCGSSLEDVLADANACADISMILQFFQSNELASICTEAGLPKGTCNMITLVDKVLGDVMQAISDAASCSSQAHVTYVEAISTIRFNGQLCDVITKVLQIINSGAIDQKCQEIDPSICPQVAQGEAMIVKVLGMVGPVLGCSSAAFPVLDNTQVCATLGQIGQAVASGEIDNLCDKFLNGSPVCKELKTLEPYVLDAIQVLGKLLQCQ